MCNAFRCLDKITFSSHSDQTAFQRRAAKYEKKMTEKKTRGDLRVNFIIWFNCDKYVRPFFKTTIILVVSPFKSLTPFYQ